MSNRLFVLIYLTIVPFTQAERTHQDGSSRPHIRYAAPDENEAKSRAFTALNEEGNRNAFREFDERDRTGGAKSLSEAIRTAALGSDWKMGRVITAAGDDNGDPAGSARFRLNPKDDSHVFLVGYPRNKSSYDFLYVVDPKRERVTKINLTEEQVEGLYLINGNLLIVTRDRKVNNGPFHAYLGDKKVGKQKNEGPISGTNPPQSFKFGDTEYSVVLPELGYIGNKKYPLGRLDLNADMFRKKPSDE